MEIPKFDGMNPKLWKKNCESYFDVYAMPSEVWVKMAVMNFTGSAAFWSQSVETILKRCTLNWGCSQRPSSGNSCRSETCGTWQTVKCRRKIAKHQELSLGKRVVFQMW